MGAVVNALERRFSSMIPCGGRYLSVDIAANGKQMNLTIEKADYEALDSQAERLAFIDFTLTEEVKKLGATAWTGNLSA